MAVSLRLLIPLLHSGDQWLPALEGWKAANADFWFPYSPRFGEAAKPQESNSELGMRLAEIGLDSARKESGPLPKITFEYAASTPEVVTIAIMIATATTVDGGRTKARLGAIVGS